MTNSNHLKLSKSQKLSLISFVLIFVFIYFIFLINLYIIPNNLEIPIIPLIGFAIFIFGIFYFFLSFINDNKIKEKLITFNFLNENCIKAILFISLIICYFIPPVSFSDTIINWEELNLLHYIRAIIFLIGSAFLPGACFYSIIFQKSKVLKKFNTESFFIKITIYPVLSLCILGTATLILDFIGLKRQFFSFFLFLFIILSYLLDAFVQKRTNRDNFFNFRFKYKITKSTLLILLFAISVIIIAVGVHLSNPYLIPGDTWRGINYAYYIGRDNSDIFDKFCGINYTLYWGYISYALSALSGIPYININVFLVIFEFLFVNSIYLFMKALFGNSKEKYIILGTIFSIIFSGLFYIVNPYLGRSNLSALIFDGIINFRFKSFAHVSLILSLAFFLITCKQSENLDITLDKENNNRRNIILIAFLMVQSFMIYFLPLIVGISFVILFTLFSKYKRYNFRILLRFFLVFILITIVLDIMSSFFFSWISRSLLLYFIGVPVYFNKDLLFINAILFYFILIFSYAIIFLIYMIYQRFVFNRFKKYYKHKPIYFFIIFLWLFTILLEIQIFINLISDFRQNFLTFYLDLTFSSIGFIGIFGIYFSYFTYIKNKKKFYLLLFWGLFIYVIASIFIFINWIKFYPLPPQNISSDSYFNMMYWFSRNWYYAIFPLSIFFSIGIIKIENYLKSKKLLRHKNIRIIQGLIFSSIITFFCLSNTIIAGMEWYNWDKVEDDDAQMIGWISENLPVGSKILIDEKNLPFLDDIIYCYNYGYDLYSEFSDALGRDKYELCYYNPKYLDWSNIYLYDSNCRVDYRENQSGKNNILNFIDNNKNGSVQLILNFNPIQEKGLIEFLIRTSNKTSGFNINCSSNDKIVGISISIKEEAFYCYNGSTFQKIINIDDNVWYYLKIHFETSSSNYSSLDQYQWKLEINSTEYGNYYLLNNISNINGIKLSTSKIDYDWYVSIDNLNFSWVNEISEIYALITRIPLIIDHLKNKNIKYFILSESYEDRFKVEELILSFYKNKLYEYNNLALFKENEI